MSRPQPPSIARAVLLYTAFDLRNLVAQWRALLTMLLLMPAMALAIGGSGVLFASITSTAETERHVLVVTEDTSLHAALQERLLQDVVVEVAVAEPADVEARLASGDLVAVVDLDPHFRDTLGYRTRVGAGTLSVRADRIEGDLRNLWLHERVQARGGEATEIVLVDADGRPVPPEQPEATSAPPTPEDAAESASETRSGFGLFVIGIFGTMLGFAVGPALAKSIKVGFNHLLALGTAPRAIFASELLTVGAVQVGQSMALWTLLTLGLVFADFALPIALPSPAVIAASAPAVVVLAVLAGLQSSAVSLVVARAAEDMPSNVRERGLGFVLFPLFVVGSQLLDLDSPRVLTTLSALPVSGPLTLWMRLDGDLPGGAALLAVQVGWTVAALFAGAWVFALDESPQAHLLRAWRRRRAASAA